MKSDNHKAVEFFFGQYKLDDIGLREDMVTSDFVFYSALEGDLSFQDYFEFTLKMRSSIENTEFAVTDDGDNRYVVSAKYLVIDFMSGFSHEIYAVLDVLFERGLIKSVKTQHDLDVETIHKINHLIS
ncbi:MAG: hypothetical protein HRU29_05750 [Rhizobiales bacterium]|nr:hypothetical protein [Hyphomicrobiales bacterium]NRB13888.1 hypothetical protein [Hyphomicrobiales bacterium]